MYNKISEEAISVREEYVMETGVFFNFRMHLFNRRTSEIFGADSLRPCHIDLFAGPSSISQSDLFNCCDVMRLAYCDAMLMLLNLQAQVKKKPL